MRAIRLSFVRVAKGSRPTVATLRPGVEEVSAFLCAHADGLIARANDGTAANARFYDDDRKQLIEDLRSGADDQFLAASDLLATRLADEMNHVARPASGLLVCTTFEGDQPSSPRLAAVLKLEVVSDQGAVLRRLDSGEETLAAVTNVLDRPGELQKGLVFADTRGDSEAVVGDKAAQNEARYYLKAMGITLDAHTNRSAAELVASVNRHTDRDTARRVVVTLPAVPSGTPREVLDGLRARDIAIPNEAAAVIVDELTSGPRPVRHVDVESRVKATIRAGAVTIKGPARDIDAIRIQPEPGGDWIITIRTDTEPSVDYS